MQIIKLCADHLRAISNKHGVKLKSGHAHELVAALFGYKSKAVLYAETQCPISNLPQADVIVLIPSPPIDLRRTELQGFPSDLPDSNTLCEDVFTRLIHEKLIVATKIWTSYDLKRQASILAYDYWHSQLKGIKPTATTDNVRVKITSEGILMSVSHQKEVDPFDKYRGTTRYEDITITIWLQRIAGYIGYAKPEISLMSYPFSKFNLGSINHD